MKKVIRDSIEKSLKSRIKGGVYLDFDKNGNLVVTIAKTTPTFKTTYYNCLSNIVKGKTVTDVSKEIYKRYKEYVYTLFFK